MDLTYSAEDEAFRQEVRDFIEEAFTPDIRRECERSKNGYITKQGHETWQKRLYEKGWAAPNWPTEHGGAGFTPTQKFIYTQEMEAAGCAAYHCFRHDNGRAGDYEIRHGRAKSQISARYFGL
jgi:alkylation response protein AidB-like acyl-CoA dehydrogenase